MEYTKRKPKRQTTLMSRNKSIRGDTIEVQVERLMAGEGIDSVEDRDLVYNDQESPVVNPITNIRTDKMEVMLEEKIGQYEWQDHKTQQADNNKNDSGNEEVIIEE